MSTHVFPRVSGYTRGSDITGVDIIEVRVYLALTMSFFVHSLKGKNITLETHLKFRKVRGKLSPEGTEASSWICYIIPPMIQLYYHIHTVHKKRF